MDVTAVDRIAVSGDTLLHRTSPVPKLIATGVMIGAVVTASDPLVTLGIALSLTGAAAAVGLPVRRMLPLAVYPGIFALFFAVAAAPGPVAGALFVLRAITAALSVLILMFTTPYPQVFAPVQRITPVVVGDSLLMTYRSLFILAEKFSDLTRAVRLRSGLSRRQPLRAAKATTRALGGLLLYSLDLSQREYDILRLRGYERGFRVTPPSDTDRAAATATLAYALAILAVAVVFRVLPTLTGYAWIVAAFGMVDLIAGAVIGRSSR